MPCRQEEILIHEVLTRELDSALHELHDQEDGLTPALLTGSDVLGSSVVHQVVSEVEGLSILENVVPTLDSTEDCVGVETPDVTVLREDHPLLDVDLFTRARLFVRTQLDLIPGSIVDVRLCRHVLLPYDASCLLWSVHGCEAHFPIELSG